MDASLVLEDFPSSSIHGKNREISGTYNFWTPVKSIILDFWNWNCWTLFGLVHFSGSPLQPFSRHPESESLWCELGMTQKLPVQSSLNFQVKGMDAEVVFRVSISLAFSFLKIWKQNISESNCMMFNRLVVISSYPIVFFYC